MCGAPSGGRSDVCMGKHILLGEIDGTVSGGASLQGWVRTDHSEDGWTVCGVGTRYC